MAQRRGPVGRSAYLGGGQHLTIAGVVGDVRLTSIVREPVAGDVLSFVADAVGDDDARRARRGRSGAADGVAPRRGVACRCGAAVFDVETMSTIVGRRLAEPRLNATLLSIFAGLALTLAAVGVAGVMAYAVARRTSELAVRQALGASPRQAMAVVMSSGLKVSMAGIVAGLAGALALGQSLSGLLYGVAPRDLTTLVATVWRWLPWRRGVLAAGAPRHPHQPNARATRAVNR